MICRNKSSLFNWALFVFIINNLFNPLTYINFILDSSNRTSTFLVRRGRLDFSYVLTLLPCEWQELGRGGGEESYIRGTLVPRDGLVHELLTKKNNNEVSVGELWQRLTGLKPLSVEHWSFPVS